jgi:HEAT repeat protein
MWHVHDEPYLNALADPNYLVRLRGVWSLAPWDPSTGRLREPGNPLFVEPLLALANDPTKNVRKAVIFTLAHIVRTESGRDGKTKLRFALGSPEWRVRFVAARAYDGLREEPFEPLVPLLSDAVESVRWAAASTLAARRRSHFTRMREDPVFDPALVSPLVQALADPAPTVRAAAVRGLEPEDGGEAFRALEAGLRDVDYRVRHWPAMVLADPRAVPGLIAALDDPYLWVRAGAARNLGQVRDPRSVEPLIGQLRTKSRYMRREAAQALASIGDPRAIPELVALRDRSTLEWIKVSAAQAIAAISGKP